MLLRRMTKHVQDQNWFAVGLDFLIVVSGVFIGVQLGNWNEQRLGYIEYEQALDRYETEIEENLERLDTLSQEVIPALGEVENGFDALLTCEDTPENRAAANLAINKIMGTYGLKINTNALEALTSDPLLLSRQTEAKKKQFTDTLFLTDVYLREAEYLETIPLQERSQENPILKIGMKQTRSISYAGVDFSRPVRLLKIDVPLNEACKNDEIIKAFYTWERWQGALPAVIRIMREQLESDLKLLKNP